MPNCNNAAYSVSKPELFTRQRLPSVISITSFATNPSAKPTVRKKLTTPTSTAHQATCTRHLCKYLRTVLKRQNTVVSPHLKYANSLLAVKVLSCELWKRRSLIALWQVLSFAGLKRLRFSERDFCNHKTGRKSHKPAHLLIK